MFREMMKDTAGIRRAGSAALDLAYVAAGRLDGFWELGLKKWDITAGIVLIQEAGGIVTDLQGREGYLESGNILTANPRLHQVMREVMEQHLTDELRNPA
jgi:myo-inositol-1(or 4)-monophosphatase